MKEIRRRRRRRLSSMACRVVTLCLALAGWDCSAPRAVALQGEAAEAVR